MLIDYIHLDFSNYLSYLCLGHYLGYRYYLHYCYYLRKLNYLCYDYWPISFFRKN